MDEKAKYLSIYQGELARIYKSQDARGRMDGGYGRACWGEGILECLAQWQVQSLLDVGCGYGRFCDAASRFVPRVIGLDIASVASGNVIDNPAIKFIDGEAKSLPIPDRSVEWVTSFDCLEHCLEEDIDTVLAEFNRVSTRGFIMSISYDPDSCAGVPLHMTVRPEVWWIEKLRRYGKVTKEGRVPITGVSYLICRKPVPKRVICYCVGGLGNRLLPLASCAELARLTGRQLVILWRNDDFRCQAAFSELFENEIATLSDDDLRYISAPKIYADPKTVSFEAALNNKNALAELVRRHGATDWNAVSLEDQAQEVIVYHNSLLPAVDENGSRGFLQQLRPVPALQSRIEAFAAEHGIDRTVMGVHARGTDFNVGIQRYADKIRTVLEERPMQRFLVCSDDSEYERQLKEMFSAHVIVRTKKDCVRRVDANANWINNTLTSNAAVQEAIVDIYLLARTDFKIFHDGSSFAQLVRMIQEPLAPFADRKSTPPPRHMPDELRRSYTMNGLIPVQEWYIDESRRDGNLHYTQEQMARLLALAENRRPGNYGDTDQWLYQMLDRFPIAGMNVLVMGSRVPFYEAICLARSAYPTTVEFQKIRSDVPGLKTMTIDELARSQDLFDAAISISTFEHTGLGRYGDPLDPEGDLKAMMMLRTKVKHNGLLFLSVPMSQDLVVWNAHRIYGQTRFPHLIAGWELLASLGTHADSETYRDQPYFQPIHVLRNDTEPHIDLLVDLFKRHPNPAFVETGTALGRGVKAALRAGFKTIYSIEENRELYAFNRTQFKDAAGVHILHGESCKVLPQIMSALHGSATFWLDAHRTGGGLNGGQMPYPLLEELRIIKSHAVCTHTLLIDDRRLFEREFGLKEECIHEAILQINPKYQLSHADSTPGHIAYGQKDILVVAPPMTIDPAAMTLTGGMTVRASECAIRKEDARGRQVRILYFCPDVTIRSAGVRRLYRHVAALNSHGFNAAVLHQQTGFTAPDQPDVPRLYLDQITLSDRDVVVIPEGQPQIMHALRNSPCRRFAIALNWDYVFKTLPNHMDWRTFNVERVLVVSPFIGHMVSWAMRLPIHLLDSSIDRQRYIYDPADKQAQVVYIQRKAVCIDPLLRILKSRNAEYIRRIQWLPMANVPEKEYASEIRRASLFLNLSPAEGFPTSCMEAMAAGTLVVGFDGVGGRDLLRHGENCLLAPNGDYVTLAYTLAPLLDNLLNGGTASWKELRENGLKTAASLTVKGETESLVQFWQSVL
jgi:glycosyltransferase involved in cell wall biosynthesis/SAM-dependent methyltransferase